MEHKKLAPISEDCRCVINFLAANLLHISDVYLSMACYYVDEKGMPPFVMFFEEQTEVKRQQAKHFLKFLRKRGSKICLPDIKTPELENWGSATQALTIAVQMEHTLEVILNDLIVKISKAGEIELRAFIIEYLEKQKRNLYYLEDQISSRRKARRKPV